MFEHAKQRALERYNREFDDNDMMQMCNMIKNQQHISIGVSDNNKHMKFCYLKYNKIPYKVLYHNNTTSPKGKIKIITIYPLDVEEYNSALDAKLQLRVQKSVEFLKSQGYIVYKRKSK